MEDLPISYVRTVAESFYDLNQLAVNNDGGVLDNRDGHLEGSHTGQIPNEGQVLR